MVNGMEYSINQLSILAGVSIRTLHYYDEIGLLTPKRASGNGYRVYGQTEVDLLQQILFYRELGLQLAEIQKMVQSNQYDGISALQNHLSALKIRKDQIERLIANVEKTIAASKGETTMMDHEKFEGFKKKNIEDNEKKYGAEIRARFGDDVINKSNAKVMSMTKEQYADAESLARQINESLKTACEAGDPAGELAQKVCGMHKKWLGYYWSTYTKEAHLGLAQAYVDDPRFAQYYNEHAGPGCAAFFLEAMKIYCK